MLTEGHLAVMDSVLICTIGFLGDLQAMYLAFIFSTILSSTTKSNKENKQTKKKTKPKTTISHINENVIPIFCDRDLNSVGNA